MNKPVLSAADLDAVKKAVADAERRTTGEIYCVVAEESSDYRETPLALAAAAALLAPAILLITGVQVSLPDALRGETWSAAQVSLAAQASAHEALLGALVLQVGLFALVAGITSLRAVRHKLTPRGLKRERVRRRAREQFLAKNLHLTRE